MPLEPSRRMRLTWWVTGIGERRVNIGFWWGYLRERNHFEDLGIDG
jgi:hypothetical protein